MTEPMTEASDAAELIVAGALLSTPNLDAARQLLETAPTEAFSHPVASFVVSVATNLVVADVLPYPLAVYTWATQHAIPVPVRSTPISALSKLAADAPLFGAASAAARDVGTNYYRRMIADSAQRLAGAAWADPNELAVLVRRENRALRRALRRLRDLGGITRAVAA